MKIIKKLIIFFFITGLLTGGFLFYEWKKEINNPTTSWPWYYDREFKYSFPYPPGWLIEEQKTQIYLISPQEKEQETENLLICEGKKQGVCEPERPPSGIFIKTILKLASQNLNQWLLQNYNNITQKEILRIDSIQGIKIQIDGLYPEYYIFFAKPSYILSIAQYFEPTPEFELIAKNIQLRKE